MEGDNNDVTAKAAETNLSAAAPEPTPLQENEETAKVIDIDELIKTAPDTVPDAEVTSESDIVSFSAPASADSELSAETSNATDMPTTESDTVQNATSDIPTTTSQVESSNNGANDISLTETDLSELVSKSEQTADSSVEPTSEEGTTTTVQFIAVSADEHARMVTAGELPESVHGADVHMQIPGADAQQVRLIAVDSNGIPVIEPAILQAAAEQAGIVFLVKDENDKDTQITIQQAMELSLSENVPLITATTATVVVDQGDEDASQADTDGNETEDDAADGEVKKPKMKKPRLKLRVYSQKDAIVTEDLSFLNEDLLTIQQPEAEAATFEQNQARPNDESVYEFQDPPTGGDAEDQVEVLEPNVFKKVGKRQSDKNRDRRKIFQCRECPFYSHRHSNLIRHIKIHTDERPFQCHLCDRAFRTSTLLRNHINTHTGTKPYKCAEAGCAMAFVTSGELTRHTRYIHTHEKPFKCTLCDYASVEISKLRRHFRSHTGERPYHCEECGKSFADSFHLKRHRMSHTGEKPYQCPECKQRFTQQGSVKMHIMQQHSKTAPKFKCEICHTLLGRKSDLNVHMRKQHAFQEAPTQCRYCDELFHDRWSLMQHQRTHRSGSQRLNEPIVRKRKRTLPPQPMVEWKKFELEEENDFLLMEEEDDTGNSEQRVTVYVEEEQNQSEPNDVIVSRPIITEIETGPIETAEKNDQVTAAEN